MIVTKAIVKLPRKTNRTGSLVVDTDYKPHQQEEGYLVSDKLYFDGLPPSVIENEIKDLVSSFNPIKVHLKHTTECACGYIQFVTKDMADRAYTLLNGTTFRGIRLQLKINPPYGDYPEPEAHAGILHVKNLPNHIDNKSLYELFRPYGPMMLCKILLEQATTFKGNALVQYFNSEHAQDAEHIMNNKQLQDNIITVLPFVSNNNNNNKWRDTPPPPPPPPSTNGCASTVTMVATPTTNTTTSSNGTVVTTSPTPQKDTTVDYTNLYIKNLDLNVKSADLFEHFRKFGRIISARVMKNAQTKQSKGFGFVSYSKADEAQKAKSDMDGIYILSKPIIVAFHEPKKPRENDPQVNSPVDTYVDHPAYYQQQQQQHQQQQIQQHHPQQQQQQHHHQQQQQQQRSRDFEQRYSHIPPLPPQTPPPVVAPTGKYYAVPQTHQQHYSPQQHSYSSHGTHVDYSPANKLYQPMERNTSRHSHSYDPRQIHIPPVKHEHYPPPPQPTKRELHGQQQQASLSALASGAYINTPPNYYHHPQSQPPPPPQQQQHATTQEARPTFRRRGSIESVASVMTETSSETRRHTVTRAVLSIEKEHHAHVEDIVDMILTLKKKDLATCLFNKVVLKTKIRQAKDALDIFQEQQHQQQQQGVSSRAIPIVAPKPQDLSEEIEKFLDTLKGLALHEKKQLLGDRLFPLVKSTGVKQAPKITIRLLDSVPLDELAYSMYDKEKLKHQVSRIVSTISTRY